MINNNHPITPPPELVEQWCHKWTIANGDFGPYLATQSARWGADQELEACRKEIVDGAGRLYIDDPKLRVRLADDICAARRHKPPSLKERGREALQNIHAAVVMETGGRELDVLKEIVESLPD